MVCIRLCCVYDIVYNIDTIVYDIVYNDIDLGELMCILKFYKMHPSLEHNRGCSVEERQNR